MPNPDEAAFKTAKVGFLLNAFADDAEFISSSPLEVFPFLGFRQGQIVESREFMDSFGAVAQLLGRPLDLQQN